MDLPIQEFSYRAEKLQNQSIRIDTPYASEPFSSTRILAKPNVWEFRIYEDVRWRDSAPVIVRDMLVQALRESNGFSHVVSDTSPAVTDWSLITELTGFHTENHTDTVNAVIRIHSWIMDNRSRATLCASDFVANQPVAGADVEQVVESFSTAGEIVSDALSQWASQCTQQIIQEISPATQPLNTGT
jgi:cholesterol transport system auxiliary component